MKTLDYTHTKAGADHGKRFVLTRMDAFSADKWARHILQAAIRGGARVGADLAEAGVAGLASLGIEIFGFMEESDLDRALDRLMQCVALRPDPAHPDTTRAVIATDFEEPDTLGLVRAEAFRLHVGFLLAAAHQLFPVVAALLGDAAQGGTEPARCVNVSPALAAVITAGLATLHELKTLYDSEDLYDLLEILSVRNWNAAHVGNAD